jgi:hypothetical protein
VPLDSPRMEGADSICPIAKQSAWLGQLTEFRLVPTGTVCGVHVVPLVVSTAPRSPTAMHSSDVKQEMDAVEKGPYSTVQLDPPLADLRIPELPAA